MYYVSLILENIDGLHMKQYRICFYIDCENNRKYKNIKIQMKEMILEMRMNRMLKMCLLAMSFITLGTLLGLLTSANASGFPQTENAWLLYPRSYSQAVWVCKTTHGESELAFDARRENGMPFRKPQEPYKKSNETQHLPM